MNYIVIVSKITFKLVLDPSGTSIQNEIISSGPLKVFGPFLSVEEIKDWIKDKYNNSEYQYDIHPVIPPTDYKE